MYAIKNNSSDNRTWQATRSEARFYLEHKTLSRYYSVFQLTVGTERVSIEDIIRKEETAYVVRNDFTGAERIVGPYEAMAYADGGKIEGYSVFVLKARRIYRLS
jgi:hypothetical protein